MNLRTFSAPTMAEALGQVKKEMGFDALILHTRTYHRRRWLGLRRREIVEITAGNAPAQPRRQRRRSSGDGSGHGSNHGQGSLFPALTALPSAAYQKSHALSAAVHEDSSGPRSRTGPRADSDAGSYTVSRPASPSSSNSSTARNANAAPLFLSVPSSATPAAEPRRSLLDTPAANGAILLNFTQEISSLKTMVADLATQTRMSQAPNVPENLFDCYSQLIESQVTPNVAAQVIRELHAQLRPEHSKQEHYIRERLADILEKMIPISGPIVRRKTGGPHVAALIGPTGVGKTTTLAKLAANLKLRENHSVGLITIDTYRIAAVEQLRKYAEILGAPLRVVSTPEELCEAVAAMKECDFILIDTAGRSPTDTLKLKELKNFLAAANPDEVHLVLSTAQSQACIERAIDCFETVRMDKVIFTKFDEAVHIGVVLNVVHKLRTGVSYVTTGQNVPDDIEVGRARHLAQLILGSE